MTTLAGGPSASYLDGIGAGARFYYPRGIAVGPDGTAYVTDEQNHRIRAVAPNGRTWTLAGRGLRGSTDSTVGAFASFKNPWAITYDTMSDTLLVGEWGNHDVRRVSLTGAVTTAAGAQGQGLSGNADGPAGAALFNTVMGVAAHPFVRGTVYLSDATNKKIRVLTCPPSATPTPAPTLSPGASASLTPSLRATPSPSSTPVPAPVLAGCTVATWIGTVGGTGNLLATDGIGGSGFLYNPNAAALGPGNNIYVTEHGSHKIRVVTPDAWARTVSGPYGTAAGPSGIRDGVGQYARYNQPQGIVYAPDFGGFVISDSTNTRELMHQASRRAARQLLTTDFLSPETIPPIAQVSACSRSQTCPRTQSPAPARPGATLASVRMRTCGTRSDSQSHRVPTASEVASFSLTISADRFDSFRRICP